MDSDPPASPYAVMLSSPSRTAEPSTNTRSKIGRAGAIVAMLVLISGAAAFAVSQHWLSLAALTPLVFVLPCAAILVLCLRGARQNSRPESHT
jgi:hypothetical protein